ncbi:MAG TPA: hypothetical protein PK624_08970 [Spirochaetota bacterium]|nr:hypothetical protein [Spirochaetota bacterium]HOR44913.1 hypothetical protein [Spirochaetota bacterium]HPK56468.1 hypothetical protein [Spirochaetota bacterium]
MRKIIFITAVAVFLGGCFDLGKEKVLKDEGNNFQISAPGSWSVMNDLNDEADIQAGSNLSGKYVMVFVEAKEDFDNIKNVDGYAELIKKNMNSTVTNMTYENHDELALDGMKAKSIILSGSVDGIKVRYFITFVESDKHFVQVIFYSLQSKFDGFLEEFKKVRATFKKASAAETKSSK